MTDLERSLLALDVDWPTTPDLTTAVMTRIAAEPEAEPEPRRRVKWGFGGWRARVAHYSQDLDNEIYFSPSLFQNINLEPTRRRHAEVIYHYYFDGSSVNDTVILRDARNGNEVGRFNPYKGGLTMYK